MEFASAVSLKGTIDNHHGPSYQLRPATQTNENRGFMRFLIWLLLFGVVPAASPQVSQQPFTITINAKKTEVRAGTPVFIKVVMTNISDHSVECGEWRSNGLDRAYKYHVTDENGETVPKTIRKHPEIGENIEPFPCIIQPGKSSKPSGGMLSHLFNFNKPGKYTVRVSRHVSSDPKSAVVRSNTITITVLPRNGPQSGGSDEE